MVSEVGMQIVNTARAKVEVSPAGSQQQAEQRQPNGKALPVEAVAPPATSNRPKVDSVDLEKVADSLNKFMQSHNRSLLFTLDEDSGRTIIKVINKDTQEIVRQFPPEELLSISKMITESLEELEVSSTGVLFEEEG